MHGGTQASSSELAPLTFEPPRAASTSAPLSILGDGSPPRWRPGERLEAVIEDACRRFAERAAVDEDARVLSFRELDARANRLARWFQARGVKCGAKVATLLGRGVDAYATLYALLKAGVVYVPLDASHPIERVNFILRDSSASLVVAELRFADRLTGCDLPQIVLTSALAGIESLSDAPLSGAERPQPAEPLCYILYTSGTTGHPKGVAVAHSSICNFVRVAAAAYGFAPGDRVYQGISTAFDFSVEEIWVSLVSGATIVPNASPMSLFDGELAAFLLSRRVTCLCCVPTLLESLDRDLPDVRLLIIGGEPCPAPLIKRWSRPGRVVINSYGPTETTVTATFGPQSPDLPITIGGPLPTYWVVILDPAGERVLPIGETGEIGVAGIGVADGYLNLDALTRARFIPDFLALPHNASERIFRTGDLGRVVERGEVEYLGRIDTQIKLRGYRIELAEIESVLLDLPGVGQAAAALKEVLPRAPELVAYYSLKPGAAPLSAEAALLRMRALLPAYMVPSFLERVPSLPMLVSDKVDRDRLPPPQSPRLRFNGGRAPPETPTERLLCEALRDSLGLDEVSTEADFFADFGAHSLLMARFCAELRRRSPGSSVSMRMVYSNSTVRRLAQALEASRVAEASAQDNEPRHRPSRLSYLSCGGLQMAAYLLIGAASILLLQASLEWTYSAIAAPSALLERSLIVAAAWFLGHNGLAIAAKWLLIGRATPKIVPLWTLAYFRFWLAKLAVRSAPAAAFPGTPIYHAYLRLLGARIGRGAVVFASLVPIAADLFEVGERAIVGRRVIATGYAVSGNRLRLDAVRIGRGAYVGEASVLDVGATIEAYAQLGHCSSLGRGQRIPKGKRFHGSPAIETQTNFRMRQELPHSGLRRGAFAIMQVASPIVLAALALALATFGVAAWGDLAEATSASPMSLLSSAFATSLGVSLAALFLSLAAVYVLPRVARLFLKAGRAYPLYGFHFALQSLVMAAGNSPFNNLLFGDSVFIEPYLRFVGWRLARAEQSSSNFGSNQAQDNPFLCLVGAGTAASDGLFLGNMRTSSSAFRLDECRLGARSFVGTDVYVPPGARIGDNCLLATKVMAPIDGPIRENVGLLGSPAIVIPRAARRDIELLERLGGAEKALRLRRKTLRNVATMGVLLASRWLIAFLTISSFALAAAIFGATDRLAILSAAAIDAALTLLVLIVLERASLGFGRLRPEVATVYDPAFWRVERYWKLSDSPLFDLFAGTPMRNLVSRSLGVRIGCMVFDDGCVITEHTLAAIGDEANLNEASVVQSHSLEEGVFKSDNIVVEAGCAIGAGALVHYGVTMRQNTVLDAGSFLMKGEITPPDSHWGGNPASVNAHAARSV